MNASQLCCPDCGSPLGAAVQVVACPRCELPLTGPDALELRRLDIALTGLDAQRAAMLHRRAVLVTALRRRRDADPAAPGAMSAAPLVPAPRTGPQGEVRAPSVQTVLLILGGLLVVVAALVFTAVSWGRLGIGARAAALAAVTAVVLAVPVPLRRRGLAATAEAASVIGVALVLLDCYAARAAGLAGLQRFGTAACLAVETGLVGLGSAAYGRLTRSRAMPVAGLVLAQSTGPLAAVALGVGPAGWSAITLCVAVVDVAAAMLFRRRTAEPSGGPLSGLLSGPVLAVAACWAVASLLFGAAGALAATVYGPALRCCASLAGTAVLGPALALRPGRLTPSARTAAAGLGGVALLVALGTPLRLMLPRPWGLPAQALTAALLAIAVFALHARRRPGPVGADPGAGDLPASAADVHGEGRTWPGPCSVGLAAAGVLVLGATTATALPELLRAVVHPLVRLSGAGGDWRLSAAVLAAVAPVAAVLAAAGFLLGRTGAAGGGAVRRQLYGGGLSIAVLVWALVPVAAGLPPGAAVAAAWAPAPFAAVVLTLRQRSGGDPAVPFCGVAVPLALALTWSLPNRVETLMAWGGSALLAMVLATVLRGAAAAWAGGFAVVVLGFEAARGGLVAGLPLHLAAFGVLGTAVATVPTAAALRRTADRRRVGAAVERAGCGAAAAALLMAAPDPAALSLALAVAGVAAFGAALRSDRRRVAPAAGATLVTASSWVRLAMAGVHAPEPYSLTVAVAALVLGGLRRRRAPGTTSWAAYGTGLTAGLLPSLAAAWVDQHWLRPLLLGLGALTVTLLGAHHRLRAPLLMGGSVLAADGLHELAPGIAQVFGILPRWVPLAAAGLLLLFLGATYEHRLRDARRLRDGLRRLG
ncbi:SCO7613 C-terminal domain-containing membrane protein [Peterkaempfera sp. SMS 1(5)a]|uniref:SCO7613 C-terminal domain-containing membrane protein n=1 Tax=Peterkaempfera podocarpi TaxID=3232308 RepID=UPI00366DC7D5